MTRKRIRHEMIANESRRNATLGRRTNGLLKKAEEFTTLCGVEVGIIVHKQCEAQIEGELDGEGNIINNVPNSTIMWPSPEIFRERLNKFMEFPAQERTRKMVTNDKFMEHQVASETESVLKAKEVVQVKESHQLMSQLIKGKTSVDELDPDQLNCLSLYSAMMLEKLERREADLNNEKQQLQLAQQQEQPMQTFDAGAFSNDHCIDAGASTSHCEMDDQPISPTTAMIQNLSNDQWFLESMSEEQNRISRGDQDEDQ